MCGIGVFFARESVPEPKVFRILFDYAAKRGTDGFGIQCICRHTKSSSFGMISDDNWNMLSEMQKTHICTSITESIFVGDLVMFNFRAAPETETFITDKFQTVEKTQPISYNSEELWLVHNGAISTETYEELNEWRQKNKIEKITKLDSEAIIWAYLKTKRNLKNTLENELYGGWSLIVYDGKKDRLLSACSWNPFAHGYIKGVGYFIHSDNDVFEQVLKSMNRRVTKCGSVVWEDFYYHERDGYRYFELDCDSGVEAAGSYKHQFKHPTWNCKEKIEHKLYLVCASGGLDSTSTAVFLKESGRDIHLVHFQYGHRGEEAEKKAVEKISEKLRVPLTIFNLKDIYKQIDNFSMLTDSNIKITTGMKPKTTNAWTCGRNMVFGTLLGAFAESMILRHNFDHVYICAGFGQLTESGVYPDNSEKFVYSLERLWKYGTLPGGRGDISFLNVCHNITKTEQIILLDYLSYIDILKYTVSCDRPIVDNGVIKQCSYIDDKYGQMPACGSGLLSWWAMKKIGVEDPREYYVIDESESYKAFVPDYISEQNTLEKVNPIDIKNRLIM